MTLKRLLVPSDFSTSSDHALQIAASLAAHDQAGITLMHVAVNPMPLVADYPMPVVDMRPTQEQIAEEAHRMLERQAKRWIPDGVPSTVKVSVGVPEKEIEAEIGEGAYDLVLMGTHGRTGVRHLLLGSVAEHVLRHSPVPVLVTR